MFACTGAVLLAFRVAGGPFPTITRPRVFCRNFILFGEAFPKEQIVILQFQQIFCKGGRVVPLHGDGPFPSPKPTPVFTLTHIPTPSSTSTPTAFHSHIGGWGVSPTRKSFRFVSFVRACACSGCLEEFDLETGLRHFLFPSGAPNFPFSLV